MSRIGKKAISVPAGVNITLSGQDVSVKGPKGQLAWKVVEEIEVKMDGNVVHITPRGDSQRHRAMWGLSRTLIANMVKGVTDGYEVVLEMVGVGYRAAMQGTKLELSLGFSHPVVIDPPAGIVFVVPKQTEIRITGIDKQAVGEMAAKVRKIRPPEPYKGKGVKYAGEKVRRKEGKKK